MEIYTCPSCGQKYTLVYTGTVVPGGKEREDAYCPNCKVLVHSEMTSQCIHTEKVDDKGNIIYDRKKIVL